MVQCAGFAVLEGAFLFAGLLSLDADEKARSAVVGVLFDLHEKHIEPFVLVQHRTTNPEFKITAIFSIQFFVL